MFARSIQSGCGHADDVAHDLTLATQAAICRLALQPQVFTACPGREILGALHDLHRARATQAVSLAVDLFINSLVNGDIMKQCCLAEVCILPAIHLLASVQKLNRRHKSPLRLSKPGTPLRTVPHLYTKKHRRLQWFQQDYGFTGKRPRRSNSLKISAKAGANCCGSAASSDCVCSRVQNSPDSSSSRLILGTWSVTTL